MRTYKPKQVEFLMDLHENKILGIKRRIRSLKFIRELVKKGYVSMLFIKDGYIPTFKYDITEQGISFLEKYLIQQ